jgi:sugar phosphate isomerase/epimerase
MTRRGFIGAGMAAPAGGLLMQASPQEKVPLGIDLFSLRTQKWTPTQYLDYCAQQKVQVVHFSEVRFVGSLEPSNLRNVREHAEKLGLEVEIGMRSICPTSKMFDAKDGTAQEQLSRMIDAAGLVGSKIVRAVLGSADDRKDGLIEKHIEDTVGVLRSMRSKAMDRNIKVAIENHAGDMQARELKTLVEEAGKDYVGVCLDSGNPLWTLEDPHLTLEVLHPYVLTSHVRDSAVWKVSQGAAVAWVQMGRGNVDIDSYVHKFVELCPGRPLSLESILTGPRVFAYRESKFWDPYKQVRAWEFERFVEIAERGKPYTDNSGSTDPATKEREALEESLAHAKKLVGAS